MPETANQQPAEPWEQHVARVEFRLTYAALPEGRKFYPDAMDGPDVPDAYGPPGRTAPGEWHGGDVLDSDDPTVTDREWFAHWAQMAINEAVHEALEWLRVDGRPWLDPHGAHEKAIYVEVARLCDKLAALADQEAHPHHPRRDDV
jgi:hypothetical protein